MRERKELEVVLKGAIMVLRETAESLDKLRWQQQSNAKLTKELGKAMRSALIAIMMVSRYRTDLQKIIERQQRTSFWHIPVKSSLKKSKEKFCSECFTPHGKDKDCDALLGEEE